MQTANTEAQSFGLPLGCVEDAYVLAINHNGAAKLRRFEAGMDADWEIGVEPAFWPRVAEAAIADFNRRLAAKGMPPGKLPEPGDRVALHPCFGRELELAMLTGGDDHPMAAQTLEAWSRLNGRDRLHLWRLVRRGVSRDRPELS